MIQFLKNIKEKLIVIEKRIIPKRIFEKLNPESFSINKFMDFASNEIKAGEIVLDTGAGCCPYKNYFSHTTYESTDFEPTINIKQKETKHTFYCSLENIPIEGDYYDSIINTQVLEHVEYPQKVINEFFRILKPKGKLFLTAPQSAGLHEEPNHFFNFTNYGLQSLFENAGFKIVSIKPRGGMFWYLAYQMIELPKTLLNQYLFESEYNKEIKFKPKPLALILIPLYILSIPFTRYIIPLVFFYLDRIDLNKKLTLGYSCYCIKPFHKIKE